MVLPRSTKFKYHLNSACGVLRIWRSISSDPCTVYNRKINFRESGARNGRGPKKGKEEGPVGPVGAGGPVSLPQDSNTRRIKLAGNQTFQYPCSCRIYAIKRPLRRCSFFPFVCLFLSSRRPVALSPNASARVRCLICARVYVYMCVRVDAFVFTYLRESPVWLGGLEDRRERVARMPSSEFNSI